MSKVYPKTYPKTYAKVYGKVNPPIFIPSGAIAYYLYSYLNATDALLEQVNRQTSTLTVRASDTNIIQSNGSITTYTSGEAALKVGAGNIIEGAATNLVTYSQDLSNVDWIKNAVTISSNAASSPRGLLEADKITPTAATIAHSIAQAQSAALQTQSIYVKDAGSRYFQILSAADVNLYANIDLQTGLITQEGSIDINPRVDTLADGWYRITATFTTAATLYFAIVGSATSTWLQAFLGNGTDGVYAWDAQLETGAVSTSPITTTTAAATRAASNTAVSTYTELGAFLENSGNSTVQARFDLSSSGTTLTATGYKYDSVLTTAMIGSIVYLPDGNIATISARPTASTLTLTPVNYATLSDDTAINVGFDWSRSTQTEAAVISLRTTAGDTNVWPVAASWSQVSKIGYPNVTLDTSVVGQVLGHSGNAKLYHDGTDLIAAIGATESSITIAASAIESAFWQYDGVNVVVHANGTAGTGAASAAPTYGATWQIGSDTSVANPANGLYASCLVTPS